MKKIENVQEFLHGQNKKTLLKFITCGSVDDGKSTLIGRLLYDTKAIFDDQLKNIRNKKTNSKIDFALLVDGLQSEIEQGITIDVAYRYFYTNYKKFIIADTPGHEQYTRNMATAASNSDAAIILIDASQGVLSQTKRHTFIAQLMGIKHIVVAINKIDLTEYSQTIYEKIISEYQNFIKEHISIDINFSFIPVSALNGDNIVTISQHTPWYEGNSLIKILEGISTQTLENENNFVFPIQYVNRPNPNFRGYCGNIISGSINKNDLVTILPSNKQSRIKDIILYKQEKDTGITGESITLTIQDNIDISRGDMIVKDTKDIEYSNNINVKLVWLDETRLDKSTQYVIKINNNLIKGNISNINYMIDIKSFKKIDVEDLKLNDIADVNITLSKKILVSTYKKYKSLGALIIIDPITNKTVASAMIESIGETLETQKKYDEFEIELNQLVNKHFPHWNAIDLKKR